MTLLMLMDPLPVLLAIFMLMGVFLLIGTVVLNGNVVFFAKIEGLFIPAFPLCLLVLKDSQRIIA
jgi:hypothetical protein